MSAADDLNLCRLDTMFGAAKGYAHTATGIGPLLQQRR